MKSKFYIYQNPCNKWMLNRLLKVARKEIYFEDRDDVYDLLDELISLQVIEGYPRSLWLPFTMNRGIDYILFSHQGNSVLASKIPQQQCEGELIASPGGDEDVRKYDETQKVTIDKEKI